MTTPWYVWGLKSYFATTPDIEVIGEASNGYEAIQIAQNLYPTLS